VPTETQQLAPLAYSPQEACRVLSIGMSSLYLLIREGKIETRKLGRRTLIPAASLHRLLQGEAA